MAQTKLPGARGPNNECTYLLESPSPIRPVVSRGLCMLDDGPANVESKVQEKKRSKVAGPTQIKKMWHVMCRK